MLYFAIEFSENLHVKDFINLNKYVYLFLIPFNLQDLVNSVEG